MALVPFDAPGRRPRIDLHETVCDCGHGHSLHRAQMRDFFARCLACAGIMARGGRTPRGDACVAFQGSLSY